MIGILLFDRDDYLKARGSRDAFYAKLVINEILNKNLKGLLISGGAHFGYTNARKTNRIIEKTHPNTVTVVLATSGLGRAKKKMEEKLSDWPEGTITKLKDTWIGQLPGPTRRFRPVSTSNNSNSNQPTVISSSKSKPNLKQDFADYLLYFGSIDNIEYGEVKNPTSIYASDVLWKELNRRSLIRFYHKLRRESRKTGHIQPEAYFRSNN